MTIKGIRDEDFTQYKKPSMFIALPKCSFKCDKEYGDRVCQNSTLTKSPDIKIDNEKIMKRYLSNPITKAICYGGLEPFDSWEDLFDSISIFRLCCDDDIVIYTGYYENEIQHYIDELKQFKNIIVKFGRFIPNQQPHYDEVLGINLASNNQYAKRIDK